MPLIIPPGYAQLTVKFHAGSTGRACVSVFGVAVATPPTITDLNAFSTSLSAYYRGQIKSPGTYDGIRALIGQDGGDPVELNSVAGAGAGTTNVEMVPPQVMVLLRKTTALAGRRNRGRTFWPDLQETHVTSAGALSSTMLTSLTTTASDILSLFSAGTVFDGMVLLHATGDTDPTPVTAYTPDPMVATLRPRFDR
jgi:hypothetical protein